jgi:hypothetical protein
MGNWVKKLTKFSTPRPSKNIKVGIFCYEKIFTLISTQNLLSFSDENATDRKKGDSMIFGTVSGD